jgi:hypothetical protein
MSFGHDTTIEELDEQIEEAVLSALTLISLDETMADSCNLKARLWGGRTPKTTRTQEDPV